MSFVASANASKRFHTCHRCPHKQAAHVETHHPRLVPGTSKARTRLSTRSYALRMDVERPAGYSSFHEKRDPNTNMNYEYNPYVRNPQKGPQILVIHRLASTSGNFTSASPHVWHRGAGITCFTVLRNPQYSTCLPHLFGRLL